MVVRPISGVSMMPVLRPGQWVVVRSVPQRREVRRGDIVALRTEAGDLVIHRFVRSLPGDRFLTRGDHSGVADAPWHWDQLLGVLLLARLDTCWANPRRATGWLISWLSGARPRRLFAPMQQILGKFCWQPTPLLGSIPVTGIAQTLRADDSGRWETQRLGDELAVYDSKTGSVHVLNQVAGTIWEETRKGKSREEILKLLVAQFPQVEHAGLATDLDRTLEELKTLELLPQ